MNLEDTDFFLDFHALLDEIENDDFVYVIGVDSSVESYWVAHWDIINNPLSILTSDNGAYWNNVTKACELSCADLPTVA